MSSPKTFREILVREIFADNYPPFSSAAERKEFVERSPIPEVARVWQLGLIFRSKGFLSEDEQKEFESLSKSPGSWGRWLENPQRSRPVEAVPLRETTLFLSPREFELLVGRSYP